MPLRLYECLICGKEIQRLKPGVPVCTCSAGGPVEEILTAPGSKMMETSDANRGKSRMKNQTKILLERSRNYTRDHEADDMIIKAKKNDLTRTGFLNKDGKKRRKIDDL